MVAIASGQGGGGGGVGDAGASCNTGFSRMAVKHNAAKASCKTV